MSPTRFVILASMRSGSRWLVELLDAHPPAVVYGEAFLADGQGSMASSAASLPYFTTYLAARPAWARHARRLQRARYLELLYRSGGEALAVGYKLMAGQAARSPWLLEYSSLRRVRVVHLVRRNLLRAIVSHKVALERHSFHPRRNSELAPVSLRLDADGLVDEIERRSAAVDGARARVGRLQLRSIEVEYEDLLRNTAEELARVCVFLGIRPPSRLPETTLVRAVPSLDAVVSNLADVGHALAGTPYAWMLEDGPAGEVGAGAR